MIKQTDDGMKVEDANVRSVLVSFDDEQKDSYVSVTEWINGDGYDIEIQKKMLSLTFLEAAAMHKALGIILGD